MAQPTISRVCTSKASHNQHWRCLLPTYDHNSSHSSVNCRFFEREPALSARQQHIWRLHRFAAIAFDTPLTRAMAASDNRSSSSLSMSALVSSAIGLQAGFSTNCRRHALQAYLALPLWICPFRTTRLEPQLGHLGRGCFSLIPPLYNHYPLITIHELELLV